MEFKQIFIVEYLDSLDFVVKIFFMKLFHTNNIDTVKECQMFFCFEIPSTLLKKRVENFQKQYQNHQNTVCQIVNNFKPYLWVIYCSEMFEIFMSCVVIV